MTGCYLVIGKIGDSRDIAVNADPEIGYRPVIITKPGSPKVNVCDWSGRVTEEIVRQNNVSAAVSDIKATINLWELNEFDTVSLDARLRLRVQHERREEGCCDTDGRRQGKF